jgi:hypothetical protein
MQKLELQNKWKNDRMEKIANDLQKQADNNNLAPIWQFIKNTRKPKVAKGAQIKNEDGTPTKNLEEEIKRWAQWTETNFTTPDETPKTTYITDREREKITATGEEDSINNSLKYIRAKSKLGKFLNEHKHMEQILTRTYSTEEALNEIKKPKRNKACGTDGIPGEAFQARQEQLLKPLHNIINQLQKGADFPKGWGEAAVAHIYKNKGKQEDCKSYRPICLAQVAYKIRPAIITRRLATILHLLTSRQQYGYKQGTSCIDALCEIQTFLGESSSKKKKKRNTTNGPKQSI